MMSFGDLLDRLMLEGIDLSVEGTLIRPLAPVRADLRPHLLAHKHRLLAGPRCACGNIAFHPFAVGGIRDWQCSACMIARSEIRMLLRYPDLADDARIEQLFPPIHPPALSLIGTAPTQTVLEGQGGPI